MYKAPHFTYCSLSPVRQRLFYDNAVCSNVEIFALHKIHTNNYIRGLLEKYQTFFLCEHLMDYNLARLHEPTLNLSAYA